MKSTGKHRTDIPHTPGDLPEKCLTCKAENAADKARVTKSKHTDEPGRTDREHAKDVLGAGPYGQGVHPNSRFGKWMKKREDRKTLTGTMALTPVLPQKEHSKINPVVEDIANRDLEDEIAEQKMRLTTYSEHDKTQPAGKAKIKQIRSLERDRGRHLIFRKHSYLAPLYQRGGEATLQMGGHQSGTQGSVWARRHGVYGSTKDLLGQENLTDIGRNEDRRN